MSRSQKTKGKAVILTTVSKEGFPHHAFLSADEWTEGENCVHLALARSSTTLENLRFRRRATLLVIHENDVLVFVLERLETPRKMLADPSRTRISLFKKARKSAPRLPGENARITGSFAFERWESSEEREHRDHIKEELELCH